MSELLHRDITVHIGTKLISGRTGTDDLSRPMLRMSFKAEKTDQKEPNTCELKLWNLAEESRAAFQEEDIATIIEAGYVGELEQIFSGELGNGSSTKQGVDWITTMQAGDGEKAFRSARINDSVKAGVKFKAVVKKLTDALGLGVGNVIKKIEAGNFRGAQEEFSKGIVLSGNPADLLEKVGKSLGFGFQIRDGQPEFFKPGETTDDEAIRLTMESGLIGTPELGEKGVVKARSLLQGGLYPARKVEIIARRIGDFDFEINGFFKVQKVTHYGDTWGLDWYSDIEATPL